MRIKICEFRAKNKVNNPITYIEVERNDKGIFYINFKGEKSYRYNSIEEAKRDIKEMYRDWLEFKMLV